MSGDAVLTDLRHLARLPAVLLNYATLLPPDWTVHFIHGDDNHQRVRADPSLHHHIQNGRLRLRSLRKMAPQHYGPAMQARDLTKAGKLTPQNRGTHLKYVHWNDNFLVDPSFWRAFSKPYLMLFETDSALCEAPSTPLSSFYRYVFTGAPWRRHTLWACRTSRVPSGYFRCVGNSGVSLWRREVMETLFADAQFMDNWGDRDHLDVWVANRLQNYPNITYVEAKQPPDYMRHYALADAVPTESDAARFSIETFYNGGYTPFAVHQPQWYLKGERLSELLSRCPTAADLKNYSLVEPPIMSNGRAAGADALSSLAGVKAPHDDDDGGSSGPAAAVLARRATRERATTREPPAASTAVKMRERATMRDAATASNTVDCAADVAPVDAMPIRSPQAVHTAMLAHIAGRALVEIGTRNGDGMACFAQAASSATAVELEPSYCAQLRARSASLLERTRSNFSVLCSDYRKAKHGELDGDVFTWWQQFPHLRNLEVLQQLRRMSDHGKIRPSAEAIVLFDPTEPTDEASWRLLHERFQWMTWAEEVQFDEREACKSSSNEQLRRKRWLCNRARGTFYFGGVPIRNVRLDVHVPEPGVRSVNGTTRFYAFRTRRTRRRLAALIHGKRAVRRAMPSSPEFSDARAVPQPFAALLGKRVELRGHQSRYRYGGGHWYVYNNSFGTVSTTLDGNSLHDLRLPVIFDAGALEAKEGSTGVRLDVPIAHLEPLKYYRKIEWGGSRKGIPTRWEKFGDDVALGDAVALGELRRRQPLTPQSPVGSSPFPQPFFLTFVTSHYLHWLCHLHKNVLLLGFQSSSLRVCTTDDETRQLALARGMLVEEASVHSSKLKAFAGLRAGKSADATRGAGTRRPGKMGHTFKSEAFAQMTLGKQACLWGMLQKLPESAVYLFLDADITLLQDPFRMFARLGAGVDHGFDIAIQDDSNGAMMLPEMNLGFLMLVNTPATRRFGDTFLTELQRNTRLNDQSVFNGVLRSLSHRLGLRLRTLNPRAFPNGFRYYERHMPAESGGEPFAYAQADNFSELVAVHHNWISGDQKKWTRAVQYGAIPRPVDTFDTFAQRMLAAFHRLPWVFRKPVRFTSQVTAEAEALQRDVCGGDASPQ